MTELQDTLDEFKRLFWQGRKLAITQSKLEKGIDVFNQAIKLAEDAGLVAEANLARACILEAESKWDEALQLLESDLFKQDLILIGLHWHLKGTVFAKLEEIRMAIECYQKAIDSPDYDTPGKAWYNMGIAYRKIKAYDKAIECYQNAIDTANYDTPSNAWNNMGVAYDMKTDYDNAIVCYQKAIESPDSHVHGKAWNNMGEAYMGKGENDKAVNCYENAAEFYTNTGESLFAEYAESRARALRIPEASRSAVEEEIIDQSAHAKRPADEEIIQDSQSVESRILTKIEQAGSDIYEQYHTKQGESGKDYILATLRGWSSSTPLISDSVRENITGGGYFLKWNGKGVVIDPGFDFIRNFDKQGFNANEIDLIIVTHNHPDHNYDLQSLDDLRYELGRRLESESDQKKWKHFLLLDEETHKSFTERRKNGKGYKAHHKPLRFDLARLDADSDECHDFRRLRAKSIPFCIKYFKTDHMLNSVGLRIECFNDGSDKPDLIVGYTSDTKYMKKLSNSKCLGGCDILIAHISEPDPAEYHKPKHVKKIHLGYRGVEKLVKACNPKLTILGEFWAGLADIRIELTQGLRKLCEPEKIIPSGTKLMINPKDKDNIKIRCTNCGRYCSMDDILVAPPAQKFGELGFVCENCRV